MTRSTSPGVTISVDGIALAHEAPGERAPVFGLPQRADHASLQFPAQKRPGMVV